MIEKEKSADTKVSNTPKTEGKVTDNQPKKQESRFLFHFNDIIAYGSEIMRGNCYQLGKGDSRIEQATEAFLTKNINCWLAGCI